MTGSGVTRAHESAGYRHEAFFYSGDSEFVDGCGRFLEDAVTSGEPALVVVDARKIGLLRERLGSDADSVYFADMARVGGNPARIIPAWREFVDRHSAPGVRLRGIGEPIYPERDADELAECQRHESLLNFAFSEREDFWLLCPYSTETLPSAVLEEAHRSHPFLAQGDIRNESSSYVAADWLSKPLSEPPLDAETLEFDERSLGRLRRFVAEAAARAGLERHRGVDAVVAVNEVATNSVEHGGGHGTLRVWTTPRRFVCDVRDGGRVDDPLVDRRAPVADRPGGRGLWIANQLCELVQLRSFPTGTVVRLHITRA
jgi:anti-sigma regulatory factor (Ser/Thr protein kinase)